MWTHWLVKQTMYGCSKHKDLVVSLASSVLKQNALLRRDMLVYMLWHSLVYIFYSFWKSSFLTQIAMWTLAWLLENVSVTFLFRLTSFPSERTTRREWQTKKKYHSFEDSCFTFINSHHLLRFLWWEVYIFYYSGWGLLPIMVCVARNKEKRNKERDGLKKGFYQYASSLVNF
jgi:hypothetical protein